MLSIILLRTVKIQLKNVFLLYTTSATHTGAASVAVSDFAEIM